jgi:hypothetical protein
MSVEEAILEKVRTLPPEKREEVLRFAESLSDEESAVEEAKRWLRDNDGKGILHNEVLADLGLAEDEFWRLGAERANRRR